MARKSNRYQVPTQQCLGGNKNAVATLYSMNIGKYEDKL